MRRQKRFTSGSLCDIPQRLASQFFIAIRLCDVAERYNADQLILPIEDEHSSDFVLVHGDPLSDPSALWRVWRVSWAPDPAVV